MQPGTEYYTVSTYKDSFLEEKVLAKDLRSKDGRRVQSNLIRR